MPVSLLSHLPGEDLLPHASEACLDIGLVNNMPESAVQATERQFLGLLQKASNGCQLRVWLYRLPGIPLSEAGRQRINTRYRDIDQLWDSHLDALIVTGTEPRASDLRREPYWNSLAKLIDWAECHTISSVWSCLAAHAAVLHLDGIGRRRLAAKRSGVYECARLSDHPLMEGVPGRFRMPHSRWNDISPAELTAFGYRVLARDENGEADVFVKQRRSTFVFFQGHPEYDTDTLFREYRRDARRYVNRESDSYPPIPHAYVDVKTAAALTGLEDRARSSRCSALIEDFPAVLGEHELRNGWRSPAIRMYANWLRHISALKERAAMPSPLHAMAAGAGAPGTSITAASQ